MSTIHIIFLLIAIAAVFVCRKFIAGYRVARAIFELYDNVFSFEWQPTEEIGKRIHVSRNKTIVSLIDDLYDKKGHRTREEFCKAFARELSGMLTELGWVETRAEKAIEEWLEDNRVLLSQLSEEDKEHHRESQRSMDALSRHCDGDSEEMTALKRDLGALMVQMDESDIWKLILVRKKPGGKRPPRLSAKARRNIMGGLQGALKEGSRE